MAQHFTKSSMSKKETRILAVVQAANPDMSGVRLLSIIRLVRRLDDMPLKEVIIT